MAIHHKTLDSSICIAPMMEYTDRHFRYLIRLLSKKVLLFTEMINSSAILNGSLEKLLGYDEIEHPIVIQLGGRDKNDLGQCCQIVNDYKYDEINLNVGCPSSAVQSGKFGASLMLEPDLLSDIIVHMQNYTNIPISIKCRIGVDEFNSYEFFKEFM